MADQVVDSLIVEIRMRTEALERGLSVAEARIDDFTRRATSSSKQQASAAKASAQEQQQAHAAIAAAATAAFVVIVSAYKRGNDAANEYTSSLKGLRSIAEGVGEDFGAAKSALNEFTDDGLIPTSAAATALKNLFARGFEADQAIDILNRLKDSAAFGRQSSLSMGDAVRSATEGLKNENSVLVDNAGVTKNVAKMWEDYAKKLGKSTNDLSLAEKRQAEYNGIMEETRYQVGDAAKYAATFAGTQAELAAATLRTEQALGRANQSGLRPFLQLLTPAVDGIGRLIDQNPELAAGLTAAAAAAFLTAGGISAVALAGDKLALVMGALQGSMGWIGGIGLAIGLIVSIAAASTNAAQSAAELNRELQDSINSARQEQAALKSYQATVADGTASHEELATAREKVLQQSPGLVTGYDEEGNAIVAGNEKIQERIALLDEQIKAQKELILLTAESTLRENAEREARAADERAAAVKRQAEATKRLQEVEAVLKKGIETGDYSDSTGYWWQRDDLETAITGAKAAYEKATADITAADNKRTEVLASNAQVRRVQYEQELDSYIAKNGELTTVQQAAAQQSIQDAAMQNLTQQQFIALLKERIANEEYMAGIEQQLATAALENSTSVKEWANSEKSLENIRKVNSAVAEAQKIKAYADTVKQGQKSTKEYGEAVKGLAKYFGTTEEAIKGNIEQYDKLAGQSLQGATQAQLKLRDSLRQAIIDLKATGAAAAETVADLQVLLDIFFKLGAGTTSSSGGGGGSARKKAWEEELEMIQRVMDADDEYAQQYLEHIEGLLQNDRLSKTERARLEKERQYAQLAVNNELAQAHIEYLENLLRRERLNAEQRLDIEKQLFDAKRSLMSQYDDFADAITSAITARAEAQRDAQLSSIQDQISAVSEWEKRQTDAIRTAMNERLDAISAEIRALDDLAKANSRADKDEEDADKMRRLQAQLAYEKDERNRQKLLEQIAALETSINKRKEQEKLEDQKQALKDQQDTIRTESEAQIKIIQNQAEQEREALNRRLQAAQAYWQQRLSMENIQQEALQFLNEASQQEIIALLEKYAPEYLNKGKLLGSQFYGGLKPKIDAVIAEIDRLRAEAAKPIIITTIHRTIYESVGGSSGKSGSAGSGLAASIAAFAAAPEASFARMVNTAQQTMDGFAYRSIQPAAVTASQGSRAASSAGKGAALQRNVNIKQTVVMQQLVPSPYQNARALRRESERLVKLL